MKLFKLFVFLFILIISGCSYDRFNIKNGDRAQVFIPESKNNYSGHLFWYYLRNENGKIIKQNKSKMLFDKNRDTIIYIHGWRGVGAFGWMNHSLMRGPAMLFPPVAILISVMYNIPDNGAIFPNEKKTVRDFNFSIFDWQNYNSIDFDFETSENLPMLENYLKNGYKKRPMMPKNLADELVLFVNKTGYDKNITIVAHSLGNQVIIRAYELLPENIKEKIKYIILLDPFTTDYYDYLFDEAHARYEWLSGSTNPDIKNDLTNLIISSDIKDKLYVIVTSDVGKSWTKNFSNPLNIITIENNYTEVPLNSRYPYKIKKYHNGVVDDFFYDRLYDNNFEF